MTTERLTTAQRSTYTIKRLDRVEPSDVRLDLPAGVRVTERLTALPLNQPAAGLDTPGYWLGPRFAGLELAQAWKDEQQLDSPDPPNAALLFYSPPGTRTSSPFGFSVWPTYDPWTVGAVVGVSPTTPGSDETRAAWTAASEAHVEREERTVAGRTAMVHSRRGSGMNSEPLGVDVLVEFPDVTVSIGVRDDGVTRDDVLAALRQL